MTVTEFYNYLNEKIPPSLSLPGDCDGLCCCPDPDREVTDVLIALDATDDVVNEAIEDGAQVILTHHPMIFGKIGGVVSGEYRSDKLIKLIKNGIAVMGFHTRLDAACRSDTRHSRRPEGRVFRLRKADKKNCRCRRLGK